jgi:hypothetical protein
MKSLVKQCTIALVATVVLLSGCGSDDDGGGAPTPTPTSTPTSNPPPPAVGAQIERMGRAAVNTALVGPFEEQQLRGQMQDAYNAAADPAEWDDQFADEMARSLAVYDALDAECGNQLLAGTAVEPGRYDALASVLADDQLYVNTESGSCEIYFGVEADALGFANDDCGGRTPLEDTIDVTYSALGTPSFGGVTDGIPEDADGTASAADFPFYDEPLDLP